MSIIAQKNYASKVSSTLMREDHIQEMVTFERMIQARNVKLDQQRLWGSGSTGAAAVGAAGMAWWPLVVVAFLLVCLLAWLRDLASRTTGANRKQHHAAPTCDQQPLAAAFLDDRRTPARPRVRRSMPSRKASAAAPTTAATTA